MFNGVVSALGMSGLVLMVLIFVFVTKEALPLFFDPHAREEASLGKMFLPQILRAGKPPGYSWQPVSGVPKVSMIPLLVGTLKVSMVAIFIAGPLGILAALYGAEFAPRSVREIYKPAVELLAGVPSVVLGFFALMVVASVMQSLFGFNTRLNAWVAGVGLAFSITPVVFTVSEDALSTVPKSLREASLALGATRWETAWSVVLPAALPGVLAACVLGLGRAVGETMIVLMASGNAAITSFSLSDSARTLSATIAAEMGEVAVGSPHHSLLFFIGVELFVITFAMNGLSRVVLRALLNRLGGAGAAR